VTHFGYRLVDLAPDDGIAPALRFPVPDRRGHGTTSFANYSYQDSRYPDPGVFAGYDLLINDFRAFAAQSTSAAVPIGDVRTNLRGSIARHNYSFGVHGEAHTAGVADPLMAADFGGFAAPARTISFLVTPFTQVIWTGQLSVRLKTTLDPRAGRLEWASAQIDLSADSGFSRELAILENEGAQTKTLSTELELTSFNRSAVMAQSYIAASLYTTGHTRFVQPAVAAAVPEPGTSALMLCGLGGVAATAARRRRRGTLPATDDGAASRAAA
jgi:hypothetical protein